MRRIIITLSNSTVIDVTGLPEPCEVEVRDYDLPRDLDDNCIDPDAYQEDAMGDRYYSYVMVANVLQEG